MLYYEKFPLFIPVVAAIFCVFFYFTQTIQRGFTGRQANNLKPQTLCTL